MAGVITQVDFTNQSENRISGRFLKSATGDWVVFPEPGVSANFSAYLYTGALETTLTHPTMQVLNVGEAYTATTTSIVYDTATPNTRLAGGYYLQTSSGEILWVVADSGYTGTTGTLTVQRGALGTTASATGLANTNVLYIMNTIVFGQATTGYVIFSYTPMPSEPGVKLFA